MANTSKAARFVVVYRTGGTDNFQWHRSLEMTRDEADASADFTRRAGRAAYVVDAALSNSIGLPDTFGGAL